MKAPAFWWREPGLAAAALAPAAAIYGAVAGRRMAAPGRRPAMPVICIGNTTVGGVGKTPTALAVATVLRGLGGRPGFLLRGYGGSLPGPVLVDASRHGPQEVGDEALLLARTAPTVVARDRPAGAALAATAGIDVLIMDDGLQNPSLAKDLVIAVFDAETGIGNGRVLPAGPLRAPLAAQWPRIDAVLIVGQGRWGEAIADEAARRDRPVLRGRLAPSLPAELAGRRVLAFAGIGRPEKFFATCREVGLEVAATRSFPDHHPFRPEVLSGLLDEARRGGLMPITTEKDAVRFGPLLGREPRLATVPVLPVTMEFEDPAAFESLIAAALVRR